MSSLQTFFVNNKNDLILLNPNTSDEIIENIEDKQREKLSKTAQKFLKMCVDTYQEWNGELSTCYVKRMKKFAKDFEIEDENDSQCPLHMMIIRIANIAKKQLAEETDRKALEKEIQKAKQEHADVAKNLPAGLKDMPEEKRKLVMEDRRQKSEARLERHIEKLKSGFISNLDEKLTILAAAKKTMDAWEKVWKALSSQDCSLQQALNQPLKELLECHFEFVPCVVKFQTIQDYKVWEAIGGGFDVMGNGLNKLSAQLELNSKSAKLDNLTKRVVKMVKPFQLELNSIVDSLNNKPEEGNLLIERADKMLKSLNTFEDEAKRETDEIMSFLENYMTSSPLDRENVNLLSRSCITLMLAIKKMRGHAEVVKLKVKTQL